MNNTGRWMAAFEQVQAEMEKLLDGLDEAQWAWSPSVKSWPIARCVNHINTVNGLVLPRLEAAIQRGKEQGLRSAGPFRYPLFDRLFVYGLEPKAPVKSQSPGIYRPQAEPEYAHTCKQFAEDQARLIACARDAEGLDLVKIKIASPVSERLRFSLGTWFNAVLAHEQNHLQQAQRVRGERGFPVSPAASAGARGKV